MSVQECISFQLCDADVLYALAAAPRLCMLWLWGISTQERTLDWYDVLAGLTTLHELTVDTVQDRIAGIPRTLHSAFGPAVG